MKYLLLIALAGVPCAFADFDLQGAIERAETGAEILVPAGTYTQPIAIKKGIRLKGEQGTVLEVESNEPAILVDAYKPVAIEGMTIQSKTKSKPQKGDSPYAVFVRAGNVALDNCTFKALGEGDQSPGAVSVQGKSNVDIRNCRFEGFEYTIQYWSGASGRVEDCILLNPGHCGISIGNGSEAVLERNIVTGSRYHGIRCTGGKITAKSNLVVRNKNRGFYIGNKSAIGEISNNLIVENATGINVFANSKLGIAHNVIVRSSYAGLVVADTAKVKVEGNIVVDNEKGLVGFSAEKGQQPSIAVDGKNLVYNNTTESEGTAGLPSKTKRVDPGFKDADGGLFATEYTGMGLDEPEALQRLWIKWQAALDGR